MLKTFRTDLHKYKRYSGKTAISLILTQQGLWAILVYRINNSIFRADIPNFLKKTLLFIGLFFQKMTEIITGISIPYSAQIGDHFYIGHFGGIIINASAVIGNNCNISQGVTIGISGRGERRGVPIIGNNVYIGANAVVAGDISVGDNVVIGANSLVTESVEPNITVVGVPARKVSENSSENYI
jgi:serine O-acetyltransferase